ncbi:unnamed protein product, partial [Iphiclides podalirius]
MRLRIILLYLFVILLKNNRVDCSPRHSKHRHRLKIDWPEKRLDRQREESIGEAGQSAEGDPHLEKSEAQDRSEEEDSRGTVDLEEMIARAGSDDALLYDLDDVELRVNFE